jgi:hypothetical protein
MGCINWAWKIQGLKSNEKVLLLAIADRADKESGVCISPIVRLSRDCGGWTRQQTNRVMKRLEGYGLISIVLRYPGTDDLSRMWTCNVMMDPEAFHAPIDKGRPGRGTIMSTSDFLSALGPRFAGKPGLAAYFSAWITALRLVDVKGDRISCRVPSEEFARKIWEHHETIVSVAQDKISPKIKRLKMFWDRPKKKS